MVLEFLRDYRTQLAEGIAASVFKGDAPTHEYIQEVAFKCGVMQDICELEADDINKFYEVTPTEKES